MTARSLRFPTILYSPTSRHRYVIRNIVLWRFKIMVFSRKRFFRGFFHGESKNVRFLLLHFLIYWLLLPTTYQSKCGVYDDVTDYMNVFEFSTSSENSTRNLHARTYTAQLLGRRDSPRIPFVKFMNFGVYDDEGCDQKDFVLFDDSPVFGHKRGQVNSGCYSKSFIFNFFLRILTNHDSTFIIIVAVKPLNFFLAHRHRRSVV